MPQITTFAEAKKYLDKFHDQSRTKYNLDNMRRLMDYLGNPQDKLRVVHVAGTSGKTSTSYYAAALLTAAGQKTGLTVSPHIGEINERVQINGRPLHERIFCEALGEFLELVEKAPVKPSWFEIMVAYAYWLFAAINVDYAVVEVGLGGLKDGTNVVSRDDKACIITDIGYDHMNVLGSSLAEIAAQKAGIIQPHNEVFCYKQAPEIMQVLQNAADAQHGRLNLVKEARNSTRMPEYQFRNWFLASEVFAFLAKRDGLNLTSQALKKSQRVLIPGRMDIRGVKGKTLVLDGAHNGQKIAAMSESFKKMFPGQKPAVMVSLKQGKDFVQVIPVLAGLASRVITTGFELSQDVPLHSLDPVRLAEHFKEYGFDAVRALPSQADAVDELLGGPEDVCLITGSLYLLGQLRESGLI